MLAVPFSVFHSDINSVYARLKQRRADDEISPRVSPPSWEFFAQAQGSSVENDDANGTPTFDFDTYGVLVGADCKVDDDFVVGVALGYERGTADIHNSGGDIDIDDFHTIAFFGKDIGNVGFINGGVHLRQTDLPLPLARTRFPSLKIFGLSTHSLAQVVAARTVAPDYIGVGPVFATPTKEIPDATLGLETMREMIAAAPCPAVAIGGIDAARLPSVLRAGAKNFAVVRAVCASENPFEAIKRLKGAA